MNLMRCRPLVSVGIVSALSFFLPLAVDEPRHGQDLDEGRAESHMRGTEAAESGKADIADILETSVDPEGVGLLEGVIELNHDETPGMFVENFDGVEIEISSDPLEDIVMRNEEGSEVRVTLPVTDQSQISSSSGIAQIENEDDVVFIPQIMESGDLRVLAVMESADAPSRLEYGFSSGNGGRIVPQDDGGFLVLDAEDNETASIDPPWAFDALGQSVPTRFEFEGEKVFQLVDIASVQPDAFPVVADPVVRARHFYYKVIDIRRQRAQPNYDQRIGGCIIGIGAGSCSVKRGLSAYRTIQTEVGISRGAVAARLGVESGSQVNVSVSCTSQTYKTNKADIHYNVYAVGDFYTYRVEKWKRYTVGARTKHTKVSTSPTKRAFSPSPELFKCKVN